MNSRKRNSKQAYLNKTLGPDTKLMKEENNTKLSDVFEGPDGITYYPCHYCNRLYKQKNLLIDHKDNCEAKAYIFTIEDEFPEEIGESPNSRTDKISIQQNILIKKDLMYRKPSKNSNFNNTLTNANNDSARNEVQQKRPQKSKEYLPLINVNYSDILHSNSDVGKSKKFSSEERKIQKRLQIEERLQNIARKLRETVTVVTPGPETANEPEINAEEVFEVKDESGQNDLNEEVEINFDGNVDCPTDFTCKKCMDKFDTAIELLRHGREKHTYPRILMAPSELRKLYDIKDRSCCPICVKPLNTNFRSFYLKHLQTHSSESEFECKVCKKRFRRFDHMKAHEKRHIITC